MVKKKIFKSVPRSKEWENNKANAHENARRANYRGGIAKTGTYTFIFVFTLSACRRFDHLGPLNRLCFYQPFPPGNRSSFQPLSLKRQSGLPEKGGLRHTVETCECFYGCFQFSQVLPYVTNTREVTFVCRLGNKRSK